MPQAYSGPGGPPNPDPPGGGLGPPCGTLGQVPAPSSPTRSVADRQELARWAAACAARVLPIFESAAPDDTRPGAALEGALAFARGEIRVSRARVLAAAAYDAATDTEDRAARAAARAAGHAVATAHMAGHARHAAAYAADARGLTRPDDPSLRHAEQAWQEAHVPTGLHDVVYAPEPSVPRQR
jgi:hypothetical protein